MFWVVDVTFWSSEMSWVAVALVGDGVVVSIL